MDIQPRWAGRLSLALCAFALPFLLGCSSLYTLTLNADEIHERLQRKLPVEREKLHIKTTIQDVEVSLPDGSDRIRLRPALVIDLPLLDPIAGKVSVDARVRYAPERGEFYLDDAVVSDLDMPRIPASQREHAEHLIALAAKAYLATAPVYRLKQDNFKHSLAKLMIKKVTIQGGQLRITMGT